MRLTAPLLSLLLLPALAGAAKVEMPEWGESSEAGGYRLGGGLWPSGLVEGDDGEDGKKDGETVAEAEGETRKFDPEKLKFYGPATADGEESAPGGSETEAAAEGAVAANESGEALPPPKDAPAQPKIEPLPPIEGELSDLYFELAPVDFLIDPQRLLTEQKSNDIKRFLEFHADESNFHIYVMVIGETQEIPDDVDLQEKHREWFPEQSTVLMLYRREHLDDTRFVYNDSVRSSLPGSVFDRIRQNCLREGGATELAPDQVEKMAIELSIQLYWLTQLMKHETPEAKQRAAETPVREMEASADAPELLREYAPGIFLEESGRRAVSVIVTAVVVLGVFAFVAFAGWCVLWWRDRDRLSGKPLIFPTFRIVPRLGGEYCGGGFVGMSFEIGDGSNLSR